MTPREGVERLGTCQLWKMPHAQLVLPARHETDSGWSHCLNWRPLDDAPDSGTEPPAVQDFDADVADTMLGNLQDREMALIHSEPPALVWVEREEGGVWSAGDWQIWDEGPPSRRRTNGRTDERFTIWHTPDGTGPIDLPIAERPTLDAAKDLAARLAAELEKP